MRHLFLYLVLIFSVISAGAQTYPTCPIQIQDHSGYENPLYEKWLSAYDIKYYDLYLNVSNKTTDISGSALILLEAERQLDTLVFELQNALSITGIFLSDNATAEEYGVPPGSIIHENDALYIKLDRLRNPGEQIRVRISYQGEAGQNRGFFAGINSVTDPDYGFDVTYTLSEPDNARDWFPAKQVLEDKIDSVRIRLECHKELMAASNGLLESITDIDGRNHLFTWRSHYPMAYYLLSFTVADYRDFSFRTALSGGTDSVLVQNFIYDTDELLIDWEEDILATGSLITAFSELLTDYPFASEKYGHAMAPMGGGMEHQTMTTINDFGFYLVAHELAHQWFGDYVTCGNWQDVWINEGFASYMEYVAAQSLLGQEAADGWMANAMSLALGERSGSVFVPRESVADTYRLFDYGLSYKKGAVLLHMIRYILDNDDLFFKILRNYINRYGNSIATGEDFREVLEVESGMDFSCFFNQWYYGEGYPRFSLNWIQQGDSVIFISEQTTTVPSVTPFFRTPFDIEIIFVDGRVKRHRFLQDEPSEQFSIFSEGVVQDIRFDPDNHILKSYSVVKQIPEGRVFSFGPNPVSDDLFIHFYNASNIDEVMITNISGREVFKRKLTENPVYFDLSTLANGPYLLVMQYANRTYTERIVKIASN